MLTSWLLEDHLALHSPQRRLRLGQPESHVHVTVEGYGGGQLGTGLLPLASRGIQRAQAQVAVGLERAHAEFLGQGEGLLVVRCGWLVLWRLAPRRNVAKQV